MEKAGPSGTATKALKPVPPGRAEQRLLQQLSTVITLLGIYLLKAYFRADTNVHRSLIPNGQNKF